MKKKVTPAIRQQTADWYEKNFKTLNAGVKYALETFPDLYESGFLNGTFDNPIVGLEYIRDAFHVLYKDSMDNLRGVFTKSELCLMIDSFNGLMLTPQIAGQHVYSKVSDSIFFNSFDKKWKISRDDLLKKIENIDSFDKVCLELWLRGFWEGHREGQDEVIKTDLEGYVSKLS